MREGEERARRTRKEEQAMFVNTGKAKVLRETALPVFRQAEEILRPLIPDVRVVEPVPTANWEKEPEIVLRWDEKPNFDNTYRSYTFISCTASIYDWDDPKPIDFHIRNHDALTLPTPIDPTAIGARIVEAMKNPAYESERIEKATK